MSASRYLAAPSMINAEPHANTGTRLEITDIFDALTEDRWSLAKREFDDHRISLAPVLAVAHCEGTRRTAGVLSVI